VGRLLSVGLVVGRLLKDSPLAKIKQLVEKTKIN
jgi:hypothetical protein